MLGGLGRIESSQLLSPRSAQDGQQLRHELNLKIAFLTSEIDRIKMNVPVHPDESYSPLRHWITDKRLAHDRMSFLLRQYRERLRTEQSGVAALEQLGAV